MPVPAPNAQQEPVRAGVASTCTTFRDLPLRFGKWERAYKRYRLWSDTGLWERILNALRSATDDPAEVLR